MIKKYIVTLPKNKDNFLFPIPKNIPKQCACCYGPADRNFNVKQSTIYWGSEYEYRSKFPICKKCKWHWILWEIAWCFFILPIGIGILTIMTFFFSFESVFIIILIIIIIVILTPIGKYILNHAKNCMTKNCSIISRPVFRHGPSFSFYNKSYAKIFAKMNKGKMEVVDV
jgi:hypothetical protein